MQTTCDKVEELQEEIKHLRTKLSEARRTQERLREQLNRSREQILELAGGLSLTRRQAGQQLEESQGRRLHLEHQLQGLQMRRTGSNTDVTAYAPRNVNKLPQQHFEADGFIGHGPALITVRRNELDIWMLRE